MVDTKINLCDNCSVHDVPVCLPDDVSFGDGRGNDNIIACRNYVAAAEDSGVAKNSTGSPTCEKEECVHYQRGDCKGCFGFTIDSFARRADA